MDERGLRDKKKRLTGWLIFVFSSALILLGVSIHLLVLGAQGGWLLHVAAEFAILALVAGKIGTLRVEDEAKDPGKAPRASGLEALRDALEPGKLKDASSLSEAASGPSEGLREALHDGFRDGFRDGLPKDLPKDQPSFLSIPTNSREKSLGKSPISTALEGDPLFSRRSAWLLLLLALVLDGLHLASGGRPYSIDVFPGADPGFYPMVWAPFAASLAAGSLLLAGEGSGFKISFLGLAVFSLHLALTVLGQDIFAARAQAAVILLWTIIFGRGFWPRILVMIFAAAYLPGERLLMATGAFASLSGLDWLNPLSGAALALDLTLKEAAFQSSGLWGLGPEHLRQLDFVAPWAMRLNALPYLTAMAGRGGLLIYATMVLSVLLALAWLAVKTRTDRGVSSLMPAWLLVASNQYLSLVLFLGWRSVGLAHPPAFLGGAGTGLEILILAVLAIPSAKEIAREKARVMALALRMALETMSAQAEKKEPEGEKAPEREKGQAESSEASSTLEPSSSDEGSTSASIKGAAASSDEAPSSNGASSSNEASSSNDASFSASTKGAPPAYGDCSSSRDFSSSRGSSSSDGNASSEIESSSEDPSSSSEAAK